MPLRDVDLRPVGRSGSAANRDLGDGGGVAPLMNDYKWDFFFVRFLETNLGGMRIRRFPYKLIVAQAVLFCIPLGVYIACTLIASGISQGAPHFGWYLATAGFTVVWAVLLFLPRVFVSTNNPFPELEALDDDDEVEVDDLFSMEAYDHIFAERKALQVTLNALVASTTAVLAFAFLQPAQADAKANLPGFGTFMTVYGWTVVMLALYSVFVRAPPVEPNQYDTTPSAPQSGIARCFHCIVLFIIDLVFHYCNVATSVHYFIFILYPLLWMFGVLPQLYPACLWVAETIVVVCFGGTPAASDVRLLVAFCLGLIYCASAVVVYVFANPVSGVLVGAAVGLLANHSNKGLVAMVGRLFSRGGAVQPLPALDQLEDCGPHGNSEAEMDARALDASAGNAADEALSPGSRPTTVVVSPPGSQRFQENSQVQMDPLRAPANNSRTVGWKVLEGLLIVGLLAAALVIGLLWSPLKIPVPLVSATAASWVADIVVLVFAFAGLLNRCLQRVYWAGFIHNPLFSSCTPSGTSTNRKPSMAGYCQIAMTYCWVAICLTYSIVFCNVTSTTTLAMQVFHGLCAARFMRWMWQHSWSAICTLAVTVWIHRLIGPQGLWGQMGLFPQLWIVWLALSKTNVFLNRLSFWMVSVWTIVLQPSQRFNGSIALLVLQLLLLPLFLAVIIASCVIGLPLIPIWGIPVFVLSFPRLLRMWPINEVRHSPAQDTPLFEPFFGHLRFAVGRLIKEGVLSNTPGSFFLLRHDQYMVIVELLESSFLYNLVLMKGLELQMTSCHTVEANRVDEIFDSAFDGSCVNEYWDHCMTPVTQVEVNCYAVSDVKLAGVFDHPDTLMAIPEVFVKSLVWIFKKSNPILSLQPRSGIRPYPSSPRMTELRNSQDSFPWRWYQSLQQQGTIACTSDANDPHEPAVQAIQACIQVMQEHGLENPTMTWLYDWFMGHTGEERTWLDDNKQLHAAVVKAIRYTVRLMYEQVAWGTVHTDEQLMQRLAEFDDSWYIGVAGSAEWSTRVRAATPNLFSIFRGDNTYRARGLTLGPATWQVGSLNPEVMRGIWGSLNLELLYFTNDDDERYSIQAHSKLLRNITVQAAEPPLGYPIYTKVELIH